MWTYDRHAPSHIKTVRVKKMQLVTVEFPPESLYKFMTTLQEILFKVHNSRGLIDRAEALTQQGGYMSRGFIAMIRGDRETAEELLPAGIREALRQQEVKK
jgi:hypothetical protein